MLMPEASSSTRDRRSLGNLARFFFQPVQLHFELTDLLIKRGGKGVGLRTTFTSRPREYGWQPLHRQLLPTAQLDGVNLQFSCYLIQGALTFDCFQGGLGLILWAELSSGFHFRSFG